jgi:hypothetical protein
MSRKTYYQTGRQVMRSHARQYKDLEDNTAKIADAVDNIVPRNYAAFALILHRHFGFDQDKIANIIAWTQELYNESLFEDLDIFKECSDEVGIDMIGEIHAKKHRVVGDLRI